MKWIVLAGALALAACGSSPHGPSPEPKIVIQEVHDPVAVSCVKDDVGPPPVYADTDTALKAADGPRQFQLLAGEHARHQVREAELEAIVQGCRFPAGYKPGP